MELDEPSNRVWLSAIDTSDEPNASHSAWDPVPLSIGDKIEIEILPDGESNSPTTITRTSESPKNLFSNVEQARLLLAAIKTCDTALMEVANGVRYIESEDEMHKIQVAIGTVLAEMDQQLISPALRRHPELLAEAEEMKIR